MALLKPLWMEAAPGDTAIEYSASEDRAGLLGTVFSREGVLDKDAGHLRVTPRALGANMSVDVAAGRCAIIGDDVSDQGTYACMSTTTVNITVPAAPPSGTRTHRIVARIKDKLANGVYTGYEWTIELMEDTGSGMPSLPNSAISLASVAVAAGTLSISSGITDLRGRASVGTPAITGDLLASGVHPAYGGRDATRPLTYSKNPDGWVVLAGWFRRTGGNVGVGANVMNYVNGGTSSTSGDPALPPDARPTGVRDFLGLTSNGYVHYAVYPNGHIGFRFNYNTTLVQNQTWFSLDGCMYRANSF